MELRQLEYFLAVAEEANFTRAAERVHISQSGVSAQVKTLEAELGAELFDRSGRTARLTPAGAAVLPLAREALDAAGAIREAVDDVNGLIRGHLTAGMVTGCEVKPWFEALAAFQLLAEKEGILCAFESAHALAHALKLAGEQPDALLVVGLSGRGDKDVAQARALLA